MKTFFWYDPYLYQSYADGVIRRCVQEVEMLGVLEACHSSPVCGNQNGINNVHKYCSVDTIGQPSTKILTILPSHVIGANSMEEYRGDMNSS